MYIILQAVSYTHLDVYKRQESYFMNVPSKSRIEFAVEISHYNHKTVFRKAAPSVPCLYGVFHYELITFRALTPASLKLNSAKPLNDLSSYFIITRNFVGTAVL